MPSPADTLPSFPNTSLTKLLKASLLRLFYKESDRDRYVFPREMIGEMLGKDSFKAVVRRKKCTVVLFTGNLF